MLAFANAKINLGLQITGKRRDGYHNIETVFYPVRIYDVVETLDAKVTGCILEGVAVPGAVEDNICLKAYQLLKQDFNLPAQQLCLLKNIPVGAGLGGGSADGAFVIKLLNDKFKLGLSIPQLEDYARQLGADCAFFIRNQPVYAEGKGDEFRDIQIDLSSYFLVLVKPDIHVSTSEAYAGIMLKDTRSSVKDLIHLPLREWKANLKNDFEASVFLKYPEIEAIKTHLYQQGAIYSAMSGSGSSVYAIFEAAVQLPELERTNKVFYNV
ncbi:4-(cytidine 5'-diphospho)-2-C-methyl-D-erythritol kinase [Pedobacter gandavensis]|uniref:4-(cytidine 5'-diphospho)-2-C-methyl-D-erythritol kinase n=1 Tax=Pedobacter gandavensis TaxID=2679963 RepID=UPI0029317F77|nr:4-(cytidine 5'-diphospho)-2-C-methyl-D-erythritol kinase [Pedobacter gandavensis]